MKFNNINEALKWIMSQRNSGTHFETFKEVCKELNNPQDEFKIIHVAGTNGKGSFIAYLRDILVGLGYKVGTMQSPHYLTHLDRIRINNENIKEEEFLRILNNNIDYYQSKNLNMFEMDYLIMCEYFKEEKIDYAIVEVGMGGRFDSTNVISKPLLSVITTIGLDHIKELGNTKELICEEKCGIIKDNCPVLIGNLDDNCLKVVENNCQKRHSKLIRIDKYECIKPGVFKYKNGRYEINSLARYQIHNAALALEALEYLIKSYDLKIVKDALKKSVWNGRYEIISNEPLIIVDGAHNIDGIKALVESLADINKTKGILFSAIKTKEYEVMLNLLKEYADELIITSFNHPLLIDGKDIAINMHLKYIDNYQDAIEYLKNKYECIIICGSLYFLSEVIGKGEICKIK